MAGEKVCDSYNQWIRPSAEICPGEVLLDEGLVETDGYLTTEQQVERILLAGESLAIAGQFDFMGDEEDFEAPPNRAMSNLDAMLAMKELRLSMERKRAEERLKRQEQESGGHMEHGSDGSRGPSESIDSERGELEKSGGHERNESGIDQGRLGQGGYGDPEKGSRSESSRFESGAGKRAGGVKRSSDQDGGAAAR